MPEADPCGSPQVTDAMHEYLAAAGTSEVLQKAHQCGTGPVAELEERLQEHYGKRHVLCVSNATNGLLALAIALGLEEEPFVTTPLTYGATLSGWLHEGNRPIFADVEASTLTIDPESVEQHVGPDTKALLSVDLFGVPADDRALRRVADAHDLWYIADAAQSFGAERGGQPASSRADALVVSFTAGKPLFAGEGAAIMTDRSDLYEKLVWHAQHPHRQKRDLRLALDNEFSLNMRMHPLAAVWANAVWDEALRRLEARQSRCFELIAALNETSLVEEIGFKERGLLPSFFRVTAAWMEEEREEDLLDVLQSRGIEARIEPASLEPIYQNPAYQAQYDESPNVTCPVAERQADRRFCLRF